MLFRDVRFDGYLHRFFYDDRDNLHDRRNLVVGEIFERQVYEYPPEVEIKPGDVVLDGGANLGLFTVYALIRGASLVICVEPGILNFCIIQKTVSYNRQPHWGDVVYLNRALWNTDDERLRFNSVLKSTGCARVAERGHRHDTSVYSITVDRIMELVRDKLDFMKLDIEGSELQALEGAASTIQRCSTKLAVCLYHKPEDSTILPAYIKTLKGADPVALTDKNKIGIWR